MSASAPATNPARTRPLLDRRRLPDLGAVRQALRAGTRRLQPVQRGIRRRLRNARLGPQLRRLVQGPVLMFRAGPWWKGLGASASGSPRRNGIVAIALLAALVTAGLSLPDAMEARRGAGLRLPLDDRAAAAAGRRAGHRRDRRAVAGRDRPAMAVAARPACAADRGAARGRARRRSASTSSSPSHRAAAGRRRRWLQRSARMSCWPATRRCIETPQADQHRAGRAAGRC